MATTRSEVSELLDSQSDAIRAMDVDRLMSHYSPDVVYFDVVPPLQFVGTAALWRRFTQWFDGFEGSIGLDLRDLNLVVSADIAVAHRFSRVRATLKNGIEVGSWVRATSSCQRSNGRWFVTHEHVSLPVDPQTRSAAVDLVP